MKRRPQPLEKQTLYLFQGDFEWLQRHHSPPGAGPVVRQLVRNYIRGIELATADSGGEIPPIKIEVLESP